MTPGRVVDQPKQTTSARGTDFLVLKERAEMRHVTSVFPYEPMLDDENLGPQRYGVDGPKLGASQFRKHGFVLVVQRFNRCATWSQVVAVHDWDSTA